MTFLHLWDVIWIITENVKANQNIAQCIFISATS